MKYLAMALALSAASLAVVLPVAAQEIPPNENVQIEYIEPENSDFQGAFERLRDRHVLEDFSRFLSPLKLEETLTLTVQQCDRDSTSPYYSPSNKAIYVCLEYISEVDEEAANALPGFSADEVRVGVFVDTLLHEMGHGLFDLFQVPVLGREEDGADQVSALVMLQFGPEIARLAIRGAAHDYLYSEEKRGPSPAWDVHAESKQRAINYLCMGYGGFPDQFQDFVDQGLITKKRAEHCKAEYRQAARSFEISFMPHIDRDLMTRVKAHNWLQPSDGRR